MSPCSDLWDLRTSTMQNTREKSQRLMPTPLPRIWWLQVGRIGHLQSVIADSRHWDLDSSPSTHDRYDSDIFMEEWRVMSNVIQSGLSWETFLSRNFLVFWICFFFFCLISWRVRIHWSPTSRSGETIMASWPQLNYSQLYIWWLRKGSPPKSITQVCEVVKIGVNMSCMIEKWRIKHHIDKYTP